MNLLLLLVGVFCTINSAFSAESLAIRHVYGTGTHYEGPHWSPTENVLYWVDIVEQQVHRLDPTSGSVTTRSIGYGPVSPVVSVKDAPELLLVCVRTELYLMPWNVTDDDTSLRLLSVIDLGLPDNRCNDGKVDAKGRLWLGTMDSSASSDLGSLYLVTEGNHLEPAVKVRPVSVSNGIAWSADNKNMFYVDTPTSNVDVFDFDIDTGVITNRRSLFSFTSNNVTGLPDGMTIDKDGYLWIACYDGGKVIKVDSQSGELVEQFNLPVTKVTSVMWGGEDLFTLYVTTTRENLSEADLALQPLAGSLFAIEGTGSQGLPENQFLYTDAANY